MDASVESFYNTFSSQLIEDYVSKNGRVQDQRQFLAAAIIPNAGRAFIPCSAHKSDQKPLSGS
jgi:hypothetical protein